MKNSMMMVMCLVFYFSFANGMEETNSSMKETKKESAKNVLARPGITGRFVSSEKMEQDKAGKEFVCANLKRFENVVSVGNLRFSWQMKEPFFYSKRSFAAINTAMKRSLESERSSGLQVASSWKKRK